MPFATLSTFFQSTVQLTEHACHIAWGKILDNARATSDCTAPQAQACAVVSHLTDLCKRSNRACVLLAIARLLAQHGHC